MRQRTKDNATSRTGTLSMRDTISIPRVMRPNTVCLLSNQDVGTVVMKNCEPFVPGLRQTVRKFVDLSATPKAAVCPKRNAVAYPEFAIETVKGRSCRRSRWNSSSKLPPVEVVSSTTVQSGACLQEGQKNKAHQYTHPRCFRRRCHLRVDHQFES